MKNERCWYKEVCNHDTCSGCIRYAEMKNLLDASGITEKRQYPTELIAGIDYSEFVRLAEIKSNIVEFVNRGQNLYICSNETGNGKTSWAIKLMLKYFDCIWAGNGFRTRGLFIHVPTLLLKLKDFNNPVSEQYKADILNADLVIWDDIASSNLSNYDLVQLLTFLDTRIFDQRSNIFTGNISSQSMLEKALGSRLASRLWNCSEVIEFKGKDRRHGTVADNQ